jgi:peptide deformylase
MPILKILQYPDSRLRTKSHKVEDVQSPKIKKIIKDMLATLANAQSCAALAATQLDIEQPPSITVINHPDINSDSDVLCLINPKILSKEDWAVEKEGCMSICPEEIHEEVKRATKIKVQAVDVKGCEFEFHAEGFLARVIQHECDHLEGVLYIDHLSKLKRFLLKRRIKKIIKNKKND